MAKFVLTAQLRLRAPNNVRQVVNQIQSGLNDIRVNVTARNIDGAERSVRNLTRATNDAADSATRMGNIFGVSLRRFTVFSIASRAIGLFSSKLSSAIDEAINFQQEMVRLSQVTDESLERLKGVSNQITLLATTLGISSSDLQGVTTVLAQAGLKARDLEIALNALAKTSLAPTFGDIKDTAEGAIAILAQFGEGAEALERQLGAINEVSAKFAVESEDLISAIRRTGGVFRASGGSLEELLALFTSVRATTRESAETIATGLRTIFTRIQRPSTIQFLRQFGVELTDLEGKFVGPYEAIRRLSEAFGNLPQGDVTFIRIAEELGGFRQIGKVIPLLQQFTLAERARQAALSGGDSLNQDVIDSQQALAIQINKVREQFLALIRGISETSTFQILLKTTLNIASAFIAVADAIKPILPLIAALAAFRFSRGIGGFLGGIGAGFSARRFAAGGLVPGSGNSDSVPAMLTPGEFVMRKSSVNKIGAGRLAAMNQNRYATGGTVEQFAPNSATISSSYIPEKNSYTFNKDAGQPFIAKGSSLQTKFNPKDKINFSITKKNLNVDNFYRGKKAKESSGLYQQYINSPAKARGFVFEEIVEEKFPKFKKNKNPYGFLDGTLDDDLVEIKSQQRTTQSELGIKLLSASISGSKSSEDRPNKIAAERLKGNILTDDPNKVNLGKLVFVNDTTPQKPASGVKPQQVDKKLGTYVTDLKPKPKFFGGAIQKFNLGSKVSQTTRRVGYIDSDVLADPVNAGIVTPEMEKLGITSIPDYMMYLAKMAATARKTGELGRFRVVAAMAGAGKSTLMLGGQNNPNVKDNATLRNTIRFPILRPSDISGATEVITATATVTQEKLDNFIKAADKTYGLSSSTKEERQEIKRRRGVRNTSSNMATAPAGAANTLFGREPGTTDSAPTDSAPMEALLGANLAKEQLRVLGIRENKRARIKREDEWVETLKKEIGLFYGSFSPTTVGHQSMMDAAIASGISPQDFLVLVGSNEALNTKDPHSFRTAVFDQDFRALMAQASFGARGATVSKKGSRDFGIPSAMEISPGESGRRRFVVPAVGSTAFVAGKDDKASKKYTDAGYKVQDVARDEGNVSGSIARDAILGGNMAEMQRLLSPEVFDVVQKNLGQLRNRAEVLPKIIENVRRKEVSALVKIEEKLSKLPARIDKKKVAADPEYAKLAEQVVELRKRRDKIKSAGAVKPFKLIDKLAKRYPEKYGLKRFATGGLVPGSGNTDSVPAMLTPGEFVIRKSSVNQIGAENLAKMNRGGAVQAIRKYGQGTIGSGVEPLSPEEQEYIRTIGPTTATRLLGIPGSKENKRKFNLTANDFDPGEARRAIAVWKNNQKQKEETLDALPVYGAAVLKKVLNFDPVLTYAEGKKYRLNTVYMGEDDSDRIQGMVAEQGTKKLISDVANYMLRGIGAQPQPITSVPNLAGITGSIFEAALRSIDNLPDDGDPDKLTFDFPRGLGGNALQIFGADAAKLAGIKTDAKFSSSDDARKSISKKVKNDQAALQGIETPTTKPPIKKASGGLVPGTGNRDTVPISLEPGSFVIRKRSVKEIGVDNLAAMPKYASGGDGMGVPALVTPGEYIYSQKEAASIGYGKLNRMNKQGVAGFAKGGAVGFRFGGTAAKSNIADSFNREGYALVKSMSEVEKMFKQFLANIETLPSGIKEAVNKVQTFQLTKDMKFKTNAGERTGDQLRGLSMGGKIGVNIGAGTQHTVKHEGAHEIDRALGGGQMASRMTGTFQNKVALELQKSLAAEGDQSAYRLDLAELWADAMAKAPVEVQNILVSTMDAAEGSKKLADYFNKAQAPVAGLADLSAEEFGAAQVLPPKKPVATTTTPPPKPSPPPKPPASPPPPKPSPPPKPPASPPPPKPLVQPSDTTPKKISAQGRPTRPDFEGGAVSISALAFILPSIQAAIQKFGDKSKDATDEMARLTIITEGAVKAILGLVAVGFAWKKADKAIKDWGNSLGKSKKQTEEKSPTAPKVPKKPTPDTKAPAKTADNAAQVKTAAATPAKTSVAPSKIADPRGDWIDVALGPKKQPRKPVKPPNNAVPAETTASSTSDEERAKKSLERSRTKVDAAQRGEGLDKLTGSKKESDSIKNNLARINPIIKNQEKVITEQTKILNEAKAADETAKKNKNLVNILETKLTQEKYAQAKAANNTKQKERDYDILNKKRLEAGKRLVAAQEQQSKAQKQINESQQKIKGLEEEKAKLSQKDVAKRQRIEKAINYEKEEKLNPALAAKTKLDKVISTQAAAEQKNSTALIRVFGQLIDARAKERAATTKVQSSEDLLKRARDNSTLATKRATDAAAKAANSSNLLSQAEQKLARARNLANTQLTKLAASNKVRDARESLFGRAKTTFTAAKDFASDKFTSLKNNRRQIAAGAGRVGAGVVGVAAMTGVVANAITDGLTAMADRRKEIAASKGDTKGAIEAAEASSVAQSFGEIFTLGGLFSAIFDRENFIKQMKIRKEVAGAEAGVETASAVTQRTIKETKANVAGGQVFNPNEFVDKIAGPLAMAQKEIRDLDPKSKKRFELEEQIAAQGREAITTFVQQNTTLEQATDAAKRFAGGNEILEKEFINLAKQAVFLREVQKQLAEANIDSFKITSAFSSANASVEAFAAGLTAGSSSLAGYIIELENARNTIGSNATNAINKIEEQLISRAGGENTALGQSIKRQGNIARTTSGFNQNVGSALSSVKINKNDAEVAKSQISSVLMNAIPADASPEMRSQLENIINQNVSTITAENVATIDISEMVKKIAKDGEALSSGFFEAAKIQSSHNVRMSELYKKREQTELKAAEAMNLAIDTQIEAAKAFQDFGGAAFTPTQNAQASIAKFNNIGSLAGVQLGGSSAADVSKASAEIGNNFFAQQRKQMIGTITGKGAFLDSEGISKDQREESKRANQQLLAFTKERVEQLKQERDIAKEKIKLEKSSLEKLISGDIQGFIEEQSASAAASVLKTGDAQLAKLFSASALGAGFKSLETQGLSKGEKSRAAGLALGAVGIRDTRSADILAETSPEIRRIEAEGQAMAAQMGNVAQQTAEFEKSEIMIDSAVINATEVKFNRALQEVSQQNAQVNSLYTTAVPADQAQLWRGGIVYANRGIFVPRGTDTVPAMLTPGEFVVNRKAVQTGNNLQILRSMNNGIGAAATPNGGSSVGAGVAAGMAMGGQVGYYSGGGLIQAFIDTFNNIGGGLSPIFDKFADAVKQLQSMELSVKLDTTNVNVNFNGASFLSNLETKLREDLINHIKNEITTQLSHDDPTGRHKWG